MRAQKKPRTPPSWSVEQDETLRAMYAEGRTAAQMGQQTGRDQADVRARVVALKLQQMEC